MGEERTEVKSEGRAVMKSGDKNYLLSRAVQRYMGGWFECM